MAMKKVEMEEHHNAYTSKLANAREAVSQGLYRKAIECAVSSFENIDGMMRYESKYGESDFSSIESIDLLLRYAPILLDFKSLKSLEELIASERRIEKNTSDSMADKVVLAQERLRHAHRMWDQIENTSDVRQDFLRRALGGDQDEYRRVAEAWEKMGLIRRTAQDNTYKLELVTRTGELVKAKCSSCGGTAEGPKALFWENLRCPECGKSVNFVILGIGREKSE